VRHFCQDYQFKLQEYCAAPKLLRRICLRLKFSRFRHMLLLGVENPLTAGREVFNDAVEFH